MWDRAIFSFNPCIPLRHLPEFMSWRDNEFIMPYRIRCQVFSWCKPPVSPFAGLNNQRKPVLKRHGDGDPVDPSSPAFDQIGDHLRDEVERDVRDLF